ncbi:MAG: hypothetical protein AAFX86_02740 [Pseudomonadota bacterium]
MRAQFFRHLIGGIALGTALGATVLAGLAWIIQPNATSLPWSFAFVGIFQMAAMGGVVGVATFLRAILNENGSEPPGGLGAATVEAPAVERDTRQALQPA